MRYFPTKITCWRWFQFQFRLFQTLLPFIFLIFGFRTGWWWALKRKLQLLVSISGSFEYKQSGKWVPNNFLFHALLSHSIMTHSSPSDFRRDDLPHFRMIDPPLQMSHHARFSILPPMNHPIRAEPREIIMENSKFNSTVIKLYTEFISFLPAA